MHNWSCQARRAPGRTFPSANASLLLGAAGRCNIFVRGACFPQGSPGSSRGAPQDVQKGREMFVFLAKLSTSSGCYRQLHQLCPHPWGVLSFWVCSSSKLTSFACLRAGNATECVWGRPQVPWGYLCFTDPFVIVVPPNQAGLLERLNYFPLQCIQKCS